MTQAFCGERVLVKGLEEQTVAELVELPVGRGNNRAIVQDISLEDPIPFEVELREAEDFDRSQASSLTAKSYKIMWVGTPVKT